MDQRFNPSPHMGALKELRSFSKDPNVNKFSQVGSQRNSEEVHQKRESLPKFIIKESSLNQTNSQRSSLTNQVPKPISSQPKHENYELEQIDIAQPLVGRFQSKPKIHTHKLHQIAELMLNPIDYSKVEFEQIKMELSKKVFFFNF